jgi:hypothetical protein
MKDRKTVLVLMLFLMLGMLVPWTEVEGTQDSRQTEESLGWDLPSYAEK